jgi:hypothetical protein
VEKEVGQYATQTAHFLPKLSKFNFDNFYGKLEKRPNSCYLHTRRFKMGMVAKLAIVEAWAKGKEWVDIFRSYGEGYDVPIGHYVLNIPDTPIVSADVHALRKEATDRGYAYCPGNPKVVEALLTHSDVKVLWWHHNPATGPGFISEMKLGSPRQTPLAIDDLVVLASTGETVNRGHGRWVSYSTSSRSLLDRAHPRCESCRGTGRHSFVHLDKDGEHVCHCVRGMS